MKDIVIVGAGGFGREVAWLIEEINEKSEEWNIVGFVDDDTSIQGTLINGYPVVGNIEWLQTKAYYVVFAIGNPLIKRELVLKLKNSQNKYPTLIHPSVRMSHYVEMGEGNIICAGNILTVNISIGDHVIINLDCTIGHDAVIKDYVTILPSVNISGYVVLEECVNVGTGTAIIQGKKIGKNTVLGASAVVVKDLPSNCTAVGSPAKPIKFHEDI